MFKFREHRGSLADSLKTQNAYTKDSLKTHLEFIYGPIEEISSESVGFDARIGWDTHLVIIKLKDKKDFFAVGQSDTDLTGL